MSKRERAEEEIKEIDAITTVLVKELDVLKKKVEVLKELMKDDEHIVR